MSRDILFVDVLYKIHYHTRFELIEVNKRFLRNEKNDISVHITNDFSEEDFYTLNNSKYVNYVVTHFRSKNDYLTIYIYKGGEE